MNDEIIDLVERTNRIVILSDSDGEASFDSAYVNYSSSSDAEENINPNSGNERGVGEKKSKMSRVSKAAFRRNRQSLAEAIFSEFNRVAFDGKLASVEVFWSTKLRTTAGLTRLKKNMTNMRPGIPQERIASIELSTKVLDSTERLRSTLLHEMVHAAAWVVDGVSKPPHGNCFKKWAKIAMRQIPNVKVTTTHDYEIHFKYAWVSIRVLEGWRFNFALLNNFFFHIQACTSKGCTFVVKRHSKSVDLNRHCCGKCKGRLVEIHPQTGNEADRSPKQKAPLSGYNLFVKQNSQAVRERLINSQRALGMNTPRVSQPEVIKECAKLWKEQKQREQE